MAAPSRHQAGRRLRPDEWSLSRSGLPKTNGPPCHPAMTGISTSAVASLISTRGARKVSQTPTASPTNPKVKPAASAHFHAAATLAWVHRIETRDIPKLFLLACYPLQALKRSLADGRSTMPQNAHNIDAAAIPLSEIDVSNPQLYADDTWGQLFARLRREAPVHYCCKSAYGPYWSVTRYSDIMAVELDHARFSSSSEHGGIQIADLPPGAQYGNFIRMDPPRHTAQRKTVAPIATPTHVAKLEGLIRERTAKVLDELPRKETFDWVDKVSIELTTMMLATLFDFPWED